MSDFALTVPLEAMVSGPQNPGATPLANLLHYLPGTIWQSTNLTGAYIQVDLGTARAIDRVGLLYTNLTSAATWRIRAAATTGALTSAPAYDSGTVPAWASASATGAKYPHALLRMAAAETYRYWRIDLTDASNLAGKFRAGRLVLGKSWQPEFNPSYGMERGFTTPTVWQETDGGSLVRTATKQQRAIGTFNLEWLSEAEREGDLYALERDCGDAGEVLVELPGESESYLHNRLIYGKLDLGRPVALSFHDTYSARFSVEALA